MAEFSKDRRRVLLSSAAFFGGAAAVASLAGARPAKAWSTYEVPATSKLGLAYTDRCGGPSDHAALIAQLRDKLAEDPSATSETATCPICGCPVTVSR
ncbi:MAG: hypothetical protein ACM3N5_02630 [Candidatus Eiseniibacteriota bacterium]